MLKKLLKSAGATVPPVDIHGVRVVPNNRARRLSLRVDAKRGDVVLTWPRRGSLRAAEKFVLENMDWVEKHRQKLPARRRFDAGACVSVAGQVYIIEHRSGRGLTRIEDNKIVVHGGAEHIHRRVRDFIKSEALRHLTALSHEKAAALGLGPAPVRLRDPQTRWGSCGPDGKLMYSWRIVFAPYDVMDYLVAHEVAHRVQMNHSPAFWRLCASLTTDAKTSRRWLNENGKSLMVWE